MPNQKVAPSRLPPPAPSSPVLCSSPAQEHPNWHTFGQYYLQSRFPWYYRTMMEQALTPYQQLQPQVQEGSHPLDLSMRNSFNNTSSFCPSFSFCNLSSQQPQLPPNSASIVGHQEQSSLLHLGANNSSQLLPVAMGQPTNSAEEEPTPFAGVSLDNVPEPNAAPPRPPSNSAPSAVEALPSPRRIFTCEYCHKTYEKQSALRMHMGSHTKPHKCPMCGKRFARLWLLNTHIRIHTGEKPYGCLTCGKQFADRSNMRAHSKIHFNKINQHAVFNILHISEND